MKRPISNEDLQKENTQSAINLAVIANDITYIKKQVNDISDKLENDYLTRTEADVKFKVINDKADTSLNALTRINWIIIGAVVMAVLGLVLIKQ